MSAPIDNRPHCVNCGEPAIFEDEHCSIVGTLWFWRCDPETARNHQSYRRRMQNERRDPGPDPVPLFVTKPQAWSW